MTAPSTRSMIRSPRIPAWSAWTGASISASPGSIATGRITRPAARRSRKSHLALGVGARAWCLRFSARAQPRIVGFVRQALERGLIGLVVGLYSWRFLVGILLRPLAATGTGHARVLRLCHGGSQRQRQDCNEDPHRLPRGSVTHARNH